jgi:hypothetical protein
MARPSGCEKIGGRMKGTPNKENKSKMLFKSLAEYLVEDNLVKFKNELDALTGKDFVNAFILLYKIKPNELESIHANDELLSIFKEKIKTK